MAPYPVFVFLPEVQTRDRHIGFNGIFKWPIKCQNQLSKPGGEIEKIDVNTKD